MFTVAQTLCLRKTRFAPRACSFTSVFRSCNIARVKPFESLDQELSPDGTLLKLVRRGDEYLILAGGAVLMSSRTHSSEEFLAKSAWHHLRQLKQPSVLIGGLGMGFTLRAVLDLFPPDATVGVVELIPAVVKWNRGPLAHLAAHPLDDSRVHVETADVASVLASNPGRFHAVLLDVDNGPAAFTDSNNAALYDDRGIASARSALKDGGLLAVWAAKDDREFAQRLRNNNFTAEVQIHRARGKKGSRHYIFLGRKS